MYTDRHPYQQSRFIVTADAVSPDVIDDENTWTMERGAIICEMRDSADIAENARLIAAAPRMRKILEQIIGSAHFRGGSYCVASGITDAIRLLNEIKASISFAIGENSKIRKLS